LIVIFVVTMIFGYSSNGSTGNDSLSRLRVLLTVI